MSARSFTLNKKRQGNVTVTKTINGVKVVLHQTMIAIEDNGAIELNTGGHTTPTTKTAINRFLELMGRSERVSQVKGKWFVNGQEFFDGMVLE